MPERTEHADTAGARGRAIGWAGRLGGPIIALAVFAALPAEPDLPAPARTVAALGVLMAVWWMTEALPLAVTALLPLALMEPLGISTTRAAAAPYANPLIFLFMGGFMLALTMERWGLHRRIALRTLTLAGARLTTMVGAFMLAAAGLSMWVSNTATAVMMLPIGLSIIAMFPSDDTTTRDAFAPCLMLALAYSCSIGGMATLIGTPPNVVLAGFVEEHYGRELGFGPWMLVGVPLAAALLTLTWLLLTRVLYPIRGAELPGGRALVREKLAELGPVSRGEALTLAVFILTAAAWISRAPLASVWPFFDRLSDPQIAIGAAVVLFALPVDPRRGVFLLDWATAAKLPWDVLLLFGGGLSLAAAIGSSGLDDAIGGAVGSLAGAPGWVVTVAVATIIVFLTEITSNTATATAFLPVLAGVAGGLGIDPITVLVPAAVASSCAFMLPVATPPNAIVFGSGKLRIGQMARAGLVLNLFSIALASLAGLVLAPLALGALDATP